MYAACVAAALVPDATASRVCDASACSSFSATFCSHPVGKSQSLPKLGRQRELHPQLRCNLGMKVCREMQRSILALQDKTASHGAIALTSSLERSWGLTAEPSSALAWPRTAHTQADEAVPSARRPQRASTKNTSSTCRGNHVRKGLGACLEP